MDIISVGSISLLPSSPLACAMRYPALPAGAFIAAFLVVIPASWLWRAGHIPTLSLIAWLFTLNIVYGTNSLLWSDNVQDRAPIWCDICERLVLKATVPTFNHGRPTAAKLIVGGPTALPACTLCICNYLAMIGGGRTVGMDRRDRRRIAVFDVGFCWGIPITFMALRKWFARPSPIAYGIPTRFLDYTVQGHRYNITQYIGCQPTTYISTPCIYVIWVPPLLLSIGSFVYAGTQ